MFIERSMTRKVITVSPEADIQQAWDRMKQFRIPSLPVVHGDSTLVGIVTDRDLRSAMPSALLSRQEAEEARERLSHVRVEAVMTENPVTVSPIDTLQDALVLFLRNNVGTLPVVDRERKVVGIISIRDMLRAFSEVLGIDEPGTLLCILADDHPGQMKRIVDAITEERIRFGSVLVARHWEEGKRAFFPYLFTNNVIRIKKKLESLGFDLPNPVEWYLPHLRKPADQ